MNSNAVALYARTTAGFDARVAHAVGGGGRAPPPPPPPPRPPPPPPPPPTPRA
jgi:hypothetical protein